ncbi:hypothetical protein THTE_0954 [Thermogutta terrifontis]|uniref:Uncharacterized protein n=1 Tax=Thermogutta terrifontis TaxID=1331910 RepID=A0A286RC71_9BACT|nr:hypothetical protein THTE_0954 [Thermogutta terrifontis]
MGFFGVMEPPRCILSNDDGKIMEIIGWVLDGQMARSYYQAGKTRKSLMPATNLRVLRVGDSKRSIAKGPHLGS